MEHVELLISAGWVLPVEPHGQVLEQHSVVIAQGRIRALLPTAEALARYAPQLHVERPGHVLLPGLVNVHTSAAMSLLRGAAAASSLPRWSAQVERLQQRWIDAEFVRDGTELALADMLTSGTTCFADVHLYPEIVAQSVAQARMRACIGLPVHEAGNAWAGSADEALDKGLRLRDEYRSDPLLTTAFAPRGALSDGTLARVQRMADELESSVVVALQEAGNAELGLARLERFGLLTPLLVAAHLPALSGAELEIAGQAGIHLAHCPQSSLELRMGVTVMSELLASGANVALGSGVPAAGNFGLLAELRSAALLANGFAPSNAPALNPHDWLKIATLNGARALGLDADVGSLLPGKWADLCCVDLQRVHSQPVYDPAAQLLHASSREQVRDVWVAGRALVFDGRLTEMDSADLLVRARRWALRIAAS